MVVYNVSDVGAVRDFKDLDISVQELILAATEARKYSYCPYRKFDAAVGAAVRTKDGTIYTGCIVENGFTNGICAEKCAVSKAIGEGKYEIVTCAVVSKSHNDFFTPCGVCRQFLAEFAKENNLQIYSVKPESSLQRVLCTSITELLPKRFSL